MLYGLFQWRPDGIYRASDAIRTYKSRGAAERAASRLYEKSNGTSNVVARRIYY